MTDKTIRLVGGPLYGSTEVVPSDCVALIRAIDDYRVVVYEPWTDDAFYFIRYGHPQELS